MMSLEKMLIVSKSKIYLLFFSNKVIHNEWKIAL